MLHGIRFVRARFFVLGFLVANCTAASPAPRAMAPLAQMPRRPVPPADLALRRFVAPECAGIAPWTRDACPFSGHVVFASEIPGGVRVHVLAGESVDRALQHMRCHVAFARESGRTRDCPLYLRGVEVRRSPDGGAIDLTSGNPSTTRALRARFASSAIL